MYALLQGHLQAMAAQMVDSDLASTRAFWRAKVGYPQFADDPRPLDECIVSQQDTHRPEETNGR